MKKSQKVPHKKRAAFLAAFREYGEIGPAAEAAGINRRLHSRWLHEDPDYPALFEEARQACVETLAVEARRRAVQGVRRLKFYMGQPIKVQELNAKGLPVFDEEGNPVMVPYVEHEYSDALLIFLLKTNDPKKYGDRSESINVNHNTNKMDPEQFAKLKRETAQQVLMGCGDDT